MKRPFHDKLASEDGFGPTGKRKNPGSVLFGGKEIKKDVHEVELEETAMAWLLRHMSMSLNP